MCLALGKLPQDLYCLCKVHLKSLVRDFKMYRIFDNSQNNGHGDLGRLNTNSFCGRNFSNALDNERTDNMMQASQGPALKVKPYKDVQTRQVCLFFVFDNQPVFCEAPSFVPQSLSKGKVFSSYKGALGRL